MKTFVELALEGNALDEEIDDFVAQWHSSSTEETLASFLGFSPQEYALWVEQPESLRFILLVRKHSLELTSVIDWDEAHLIAARSSQDAKILLSWLSNKGYL